MPQKLKPRKKRVIKRKKDKAIPLPQLDDEESVHMRRLEECERVINELDNLTVWKIVCKDLEVQRQMLDDNWQEINEPEKLQKARELKFATLHILNLKQKYQEELESIQKLLGLMKNTENEVIKDYDLE